MRFSAFNYVIIDGYSPSRSQTPPQSKEGRRGDTKIKPGAEFSVRHSPKCVTQSPVYRKIETGTTTEKERILPQKATKYLEVGLPSINFVAFWEKVSYFP